VNRGGGRTGAAHVGPDAARAAAFDDARRWGQPGYAVRQGLGTFISTILEIWK